MKKIISCALLLVFMSSISLGQVGTDDPSTRGFKRDFAAVIFGGIAGGVLGLSTLSFYGEPQEHTSNITTGALLGMIAGFSFVIYNRYDLKQNPPRNEFSMGSFSNTQNRFAKNHNEIEVPLYIRQF